MCLLHIIVGFDHSNSFMGMLGIILDSFYMSKLERICLLLGLTVGHFGTSSKVWRLGWIESLQDMVGILWDRYWKMVDLVSKNLPY